MLRHYLIIAFRNLSRNKIFSLINILGLAVGMGVCLLIYQYVRFEMSYDQFHSNAQNTFRITQTTFRNGVNLGTSAFTTYGLGVRAKETIPEMEDMVRIHPPYVNPSVTNPEINISFKEEKVWYVDPNFLQFFDFPLKFGYKESLLEDQQSVVITEDMALKYFGVKDAIGKELAFNSGILPGETFTVTGILQNIPTNSHLQFDFLLPIQFMLKANRFYRESDSEGWKLADFITYVKLNDSARPSQLNEKLDQLIQTYAGKELSKLNEKWEIGLQPLLKIHLESDFIRELAKNNGSLQNVRFCLIVAVFILFMAWVNYVNLATAQSLQRVKEVGVRKTVGASRKQLIKQFLFESALVNITAAVLSVCLALAMLSIFNQIIGKKIEFVLLQDFEFWSWFSLVVVSGSLFSGLYPAFILSSFKPIGLFKALVPSQKDGVSLRKSLIVFQFWISVLLIAGTYLVYQQIMFMKHQDLGIDMEKILVVEGARIFEKEREKTTGSNYQPFKNKVMEHHSISGVTVGSSVPGKDYYYTEGFRFDGEPMDKNVEASYGIVDTDFVEAYGLEYLAKVPFPKDIAPDELMLINEEALKAFGFESPEAALNEILINNYGDRAKIAGVIKNFFWHSPKETQPPTLFILNNEYGAYYSIQMNLSDLKSSIAHIESSFKASFPGNPFDYFFLDDNFNRQYQADLQFQNLFTAFSLLAIFIACLGLFALVSFSATLKIKEIGVRKVLGASMGNLMLLLSKEYLLLLSVAVVLAVPVIIFGASFWLKNYAYRIAIGLDLLIIPVLILFFIALMTVSYRTYVAASANPVDSLKSE